MVQRDESVTTRVEAIATARPEIPAQLNDRAGDIWEPLLTLADLAGGEWPKLARDAALQMSAGMPDGSLSAVSSRTDPALADDLVEAVRTFVAKEVMPVASELEHADAYPDDLVAAMRELGLFGCLVPAEHGGLGLDIVTYARIVAELAAGWMSLTGVLNTHMIVATLLDQHGTPLYRTANKIKIGFVT